MQNAEILWIFNMLDLYLTLTEQCFVFPFETD